MERELIFPGVVKYGMKDAKGQNAVRRVQEWLCLRAMNTFSRIPRIVIDGDFGPATRAAVKEYAEHHFRAGNLKGIVDSAMWTSLTTPMNLALRSIFPVLHGKQTLTPQELICYYARQHLDSGACEVGGENRGPWVRLYCQGKETLWCAGFVSYILRQAFGRPPLPHTLSCDVLAASAQKTGLFVSGADVLKKKLTLHAGSVFLIRKRPGDWIHTGIVIGHQAGVIGTIEGNTNDDGAREGYEVAKRLRKITASIDFIVFKSAA